MKARFEILIVPYENPLFPWTTQPVEKSRWSDGKGREPVIPNTTITGSMSGATCEQFLLVMSMLEYTWNVTSVRA